VQAVCDPHHARGPERPAHCSGKTKGKIGCHVGKVESERLRVHSWDGGEQAVPSCQAAVAKVG
jgi:hypothetical protein